MVDCIGLTSGSVRARIERASGSYPGAANLDAASAGSETTLSHRMERPI
jgi:hypothetical protein